MRGVPYGDVNLLTVSRQPVNSKVKDNLQYDHHHYGSFFDQIQGFWSILDGDLTLDPPSMMFSQHYVRHRTFKGQASSGTVSIFDTVLDVTCFDNEFRLYGLDSPFNRVSFGPDGSIEYDGEGTAANMYDITPILDWLSERDSVSYSFDDSGFLIETTLSGFHYEVSDHVEFDYHASITTSAGSYLAHNNYDVSYSSGALKVISDVMSPEHLVGIGTDSFSLTISNHVSDNAIYGNFSQNSTEVLYAPFTGVPFVDDTKFISQDRLSRKMQSYGLPFWKSVELSLRDITALSRDTTTVALNRLASQAYEPTVGRISAINPLKSAGDTLLAKTADAALGDFFRMSWKQILKPGGGAGLVRYRTVFSDALQLINSLEILDSLKNEPSKLYVANAFYDYHVVIGGRYCKIRVRSKAYLVLSPFRLLQILIGKQAVTILNDLLALYYTSIPLGEILLTVLQLRKVSDIVTGRMFYDLPLFFVHTYEVESQLSQAELDDTGISNVSGDPVRLVYYMRDVSQHLPVLRFSNLSPFYGTGDVGNIVWSLLQQLVGVLSSSL
jgi:hypothetical protein